jgi:2,4-diketo-3-deoxy-L-fuconate hydrolase
MRLINARGRCALLMDGGAVDVAVASRGRFGPGFATVYESWDEFVRWAEGLEEPAGVAAAPAENELWAPVDRPQQVFAVGINYAEHADESGYERPVDELPVFTKFASSLTGPFGEIMLSGDRVDWEVELVAVIGRGGRDIPEDEGWASVAGLMVGQDISDRRVQFATTPPQFSLGKSFPGYGPLGPCLAALDEIPDPDNLALRCSLNGELVQEGNTGEMLFALPRLISSLSSVCLLMPGDVIFTGTPAGIGMGRTPPRYLAPGDVLESEIEHIGHMRHHFVA